MLVYEPGRHIKVVLLAIGLPRVKITEALKIMQGAVADAPPFKLTVACGFTALHLRTFLNAHLQLALGNRSVNITEGLYGDLCGTLEFVGEPDAVAVLIEWPDLDPRLDFRNSGAWGHDTAIGVVEQASLTLSRIAVALEKIPAGIPIALSLPTLPVPPLFPTPGWLWSEAELLLKARVLHFAADLAREARVRVISVERLAHESPWESRFDLKADLKAGLPYTVKHAERMAAVLSNALVPPAPKKGVITDLDDTLWKGIVGEVGPENVQWDLASDAQVHGLYQKLLGSLAEHGTLVGVASKNDPSVVAAAFERADLILRPEQVFPIEAGWHAKSASVSRILRTWNIAADSVIFVDDSPMELAEVSAEHPGIECMLFPKGDPLAALQLMRHLRDLCGKDKVSAEDSLRMASIRQGAAFREQVEGGAASEAFLMQANAAITFDFSAAAEPRALELVNKTNQFNLNGRRYAQAEWNRENSSDRAIVLAVNYEDKFGPLGTIAVVKGRFKGEHFLVDTWVMSCRAFSRRIEHQTLRTLFDTVGTADIEFMFESTAKNAPLQDFFAAYLGGRPTAAFSLSRTQFEQSCPSLYHEVRETRRAEAHG
jgi:FkbH-like protein